MPDVLPSDFWAKEEEYLTGVLLLLLEEISLDGVQLQAAELLDDAQLGFDDTSAGARAAAWARRHAGELVKQIADTSRTAIGEAVASWIETPGATMQDLTDSLQRILGSNVARAQRIAVTETTRAYAEGADEARRAAGLPATQFKPPLHVSCRCWDSPTQLESGEWVVVWQTNRDEVVCHTLFPTPWGEVRGCADMQGRVISAGPLFGQFV
jgi:hypothetical protein